MTGTFMDRVELLIVLIGRSVHSDSRDWWVRSGDGDSEMILRDAVNVIDRNLRPLFAGPRMRTAEDDLYHRSEDSSHENFRELIEF
jgi:hypothetical protein